MLQDLLLTSIEWNNNIQCSKTVTIYIRSLNINCAKTVAYSSVVNISIPILHTLYRTHILLQSKKSSLN